MCKRERESDEIPRTNNNIGDVENESRTKRFATDPGLVRFVNVSQGCSVSEISGAGNQSS